MAGIDTMRGVGFQHAAAVLACVDALSDPKVWSVTVEGEDDVIDVFARDGDGRVVWARQLKTRAEPHTWGRSDIATVVRAWSGTDLAGKVPFGFATDGHLGSSALALAIQLAEDHESAEADLGVPRGSLARVAVTSRMPNAASLLDKAQLHLIRAGEPIVTAAHAEARVSALLKEIVLASGDPDVRARTFNVEELSMMLGLVPRSVQSAAPSVASVTRSLADRAETVAVVMERLLLDSPTRGRVALWGFSGFGKTTVANQVHDAVVARGQSALFVRLDRSDDSHSAIARVVAQLTGTAPTNGALSVLAAELMVASAAVDLLICDDVGREDVAATLAASVAPRTALIITQQSQHVPDPFEATEVGPVDTSSVSTILRAEVPEVDVDELAELVCGWPLLLDLVRTSIRTHLGAGGSADEVVAHHARALLAVGTAGHQDLYARAEAVVRVALEALTPAVRDAARRIAVVRSSAPLELPVYARLWEVDTAAARHIAVALSSVAIVRVAGPGEIATHDALISALRAMVDAQDLVSFEARFAHSVAPDAEDLEDYFLEFLPLHLAAGGDTTDALKLLVSPEWSERVTSGLGTPMHLSRQALGVMTAATGETPILDSIAAWLIHRLYGSQYVLDRRVAVAFAAAYGLEMTEVLLKASGSSHESASVHAELAVSLMRAGRLSEAERNARAALAAARADADLDLPDAVLVTVQTLARAAREWVSTSLETIEYVIGRQKDEASQALTRAVAAATLLPLDPTLASRVATPLISRVRESLSAGETLEDVLGWSAPDTIRNLLPVLAFSDEDMAAELALLADAERLSPRNSSERYLLPGLLLGGRHLSESELGDVVSDGTVSVRDLVELLADSGRFDEAEHLIQSVDGRRRRAVLFSILGRVMHVAGQPASLVDRCFDRAVALLRGIPEAETVVALPQIAEAMIDYDTAWARKLAEQSIRYANAVTRLGERVTVEGTAAALLSSIDPGAAPPQIGRLLSDATASRPSRYADTSRSSLSYLEQSLYAAVVRSLEPAHFAALLQSRRYSGEAAPRYWDRWADRLASSRDTLEALCALDDPYFSSWACELSGTAAIVTSVLLDTPPEPDWDTIAEEFDGGFRQAFEAELSLLRFARGLSSEATVLRALRRMEDEHRIRGLAGLRCLLSMSRGDPRGALAEMLDGYKERRAWREVRERGRDSGVGGPRLPQAVVEELKGRISVADVTSVVADSDGHPALVVFTTEVLPLAADISIGGLETVAAHVGGESYRSREVMRAGLELLLEADATAVASWLCDQETNEDYLGSDWDIDEWAHLAAACLESGQLGAAERKRLVDDARARFAGLAFGVETSVAIRLVSDLAPADAAEARSFVESATSPFMLGPALCHLAGARSQVDADWKEAFLAGLEISRSGGESIATVSLVAGQSIGRVGSSGLRQLIAMGVLRAWPGQIVGSAYGAAGMSSTLAAAGEATEVLEFIDLVRLAERLALEGT